MTKRLQFLSAGSTRREALAGAGAMLFAVPQARAFSLLVEPSATEPASAGGDLAEPARSPPPQPAPAPVVAALRHVAETVAPALSRTAGGNLVLSSGSILSVVAALAGGRPDAARRGLPEEVRVSLALPAEELRALLLPSADSTLRAAGGLWHAPDLSLHPAFAAHVAGMLGAVPQAVPSGELAAIVNAWVARETEGQIPRLLEDGAPNARLIAASAVALRGRWGTRFEPEATRPARFRPATGGQVETPLMAVRLAASALLGRDMRAVMLPYAGGRYGFVAVRRTERSRTAPTLGQLYASVAALPDGSVAGTRWATRDVAVRLPRFTLEVGGDVADALSRGGYGAVIGTTLDAAATEPVLIREVIHKARIAVDEEGTTAAAATAAVGIRTMAPPPEELVFDQPFAFAVVDLARRFPVFTGVLNAPPR